MAEKKKTSKTGSKTAPKKTAKKEKKSYSPPKTGKPKSYTPDQLKKAVAKYFRKITRVQEVFEMVPSGRFDDYGHPIMVPKPVKNQDGETIKRTEYLVTPCVSSLCDFLGISRSTWARYSNDDDYCDTTSYARGRFQNYLEQENLERDDKHLKGIQFDLMNNYGYREKMDISSESVEDYLKNAMQAGGEQSL